MRSAATALAVVLAAATAHADIGMHQAIDICGRDVKFAVRPHDGLRAVPLNAEVSVWGEARELPEDAENVRSVNGQTVRFDKVALRRGPYLVPLDVTIVQLGTKRLFKLRPREQLAPETEHQVIIGGRKVACFLTGAEVDRRPPRPPELTGVVLRGPWNLHADSLAPFDFAWSLDMGDLADDQAYYLLSVSHSGGLDRKLVNVSEGPRLRCFERAGSRRSHRSPATSSSRSSPSISPEMNRRRFA